MTYEQGQAWLEEAERLATADALSDELRQTAPSAATDREFADWLARWLRLSVSPGAFTAFRRMNLETDVRHVLPAIRVPTLILQRSGDRVLDPHVSRYLADRIPTATHVELPGADHFPYSPDEQQALVDAVESFVVEVVRDPPPLDDGDRVLATVLFTDLVDSSRRAAELGDARWRELLRDHNALVRRQLARYRGRELDVAGDGFFASFDGPARAIRCATAIIDAVRELGLEIRAGLHTGECELLDHKVTGIAVHIGARVAAEAAPGEVLVSRTVRDLVSGSGLCFDDRGTRTLHGIPGEWQLYAVVPCA